MTIDAQTLEATSAAGRLPILTAAHLGTQLGQASALPGLLAAAGRSLRK